MAKPGKKLDLAADVSMALYILGDKLAGDLGTKVANGINVLLNREVGPCSETCEHNKPER
ncbi:hypothetical protein ACFXB3_07285 [Streptomyces sp. NPDC059447]|uniref:hypothetical protein n=1 Tax=Streptomyces sp. NPDC059447 TaxID=3346834 RepID=UPI0036837B17